MVTIKNKSIKCDLGEYTLREFDKMSNILNNPDKDNIDKWFDILQVLGLSEEECDNLTTEEFFELVNTVKSSNVSSADIKQIKRITIQGYEYVACEDSEEFKMKAKDLGKIQELMKTDHSYSKALAVIFKRVDLTKKEHYDNAHIKHKAELFAELNVLDYMFYINYLQATISKQVSNILKSE